MLRGIVARATRYFRSMSCWSVPAAMPFASIPARATAPGAGLFGQANTFIGTQDGGNPFLHAPVNRAVAPRRLVVRDSSGAPLQA